MKIKLLSILLLIGLVFSNCNFDKEQTYDRPQSPWVFRSVLDQQPRMVTLALNDNLWAAYSAKDATLYKVWKGNVNLVGAVYNTAHGPQPQSIGDAWFINKIKKPWKITKDDKTLEYKIQYNGHRFEKGQAYLMYDVILEDGSSFSVEEKPEYVSKGEKAGFERTFITTNVANNLSLAYEMNVSSVVSEDQITSTESISTSNKKLRSHNGVQGFDFNATATIKSNGITKITTQFLKKPLIADKNSTKKDEEETAHPGEQLIAKSDCRTCHNTIAKTVGPSYLSIAKEYRTTSDNIAMLANKVIMGGSGNWGDAAMSAHPDLMEDDAKQMVSYILSLDGEEEGEAEEEKVITESDYLQPDTSIKFGSLFPGLLNKVWNTKVSSVNDIDVSKRPNYGGSISAVEVRPTNFGTLTDNFAVQIMGYLQVEDAGVYTLQLSSDDGSKLWINGKQVIDHDGFHGASAKDVKLGFQKGTYPIEIRFFQGLGGKALYLKWKKEGDKLFTIIPQANLGHDPKARKAINGLNNAIAVGTTAQIPGDGAPLADVHPSYDLFQARPETFLPKVGGLDLLSDGRVVVSTWDANGSVYIVSGTETGDQEQMTTLKIADGLAEPLGLKVVDDEIYVLQKHELTKLVDLDGDEIIDEYRTVSNDWKVSANFHEFAFGLVYQEGFFYATLATAILPGGASANPQIPDRGKVVKISKEDGHTEFVAHGLRTPNGIGVGTDNEIFVADNQGDWLPASKIVHVTQDAWFGSRSVDFEGTANLTETQPVVWLPQDEIGNSPSTPIALNDGPYKGQMIHGEVTNGGIKRVFVEKVNGAYQGCLFRFMQGLEAGVNRLTWANDGSLYIGGIGNPGNWSHEGKNWYGLQRVKYNGETTFEMLAVRAKSNGMEIEFTEPLPKGVGWNPNHYMAKQWYYQPTAEYGGPKMDERDLPIKSVSVSEDRKKVFLELKGMKEQHVVYIKLLEPFVSEAGREIWSTEAWYTLNAIPKDKEGFVFSNDEVYRNNQLTTAEKEAGWKLLFDGKTTKGWRNFKKDNIGSSWKVRNGALMLDVSDKKEGAWQSTNGGDIITEGTYENYELSLEWKIQDCGNSGIIFNVVEEDQYDYVWQTGPEMQILDNTCHPDARYETHRAGDLYDMMECSYVTVKPADEWNKVRLIINNGKAQHWLNGRKVVEYEMFKENWEQMIRDSKFKDMSGFGKAKKGHIALQDHGDEVAFRNIKIREL